MYIQKSALEADPRPGSENPEKLNRLQFTNKNPTRMKKELHYSHQKYRQLENLFPKTEKDNTGH